MLHHGLTLFLPHLHSCCRLNGNLKMLLILSSHGSLPFQVILLYVHMHKRASPRRLRLNADAFADSNGAYMATTTTNGRWHVGIATAGQTGGSDSDGAAPVTAQPRSEVAQTENRESALPHTNGAMAGNSASRDDVVEAQDGATPYKV
jgi:hypothetical protein